MRQHPGDPARRNRLDRPLALTIAAAIVFIVARTKDGRVRTGRTTVREAAPDKSYEALAAAHSRAMARLSRDIADAVGVLEGSGQ